ncbi:MAG: hypothetical protein IJH36_04760, partial [Clostridia bacterium]|nr:hypothetical protein [Clostridia bacterium]
GELFPVYEELKGSVGSFEWKVLDDTSARIAVLSGNDSSRAQLRGEGEGETRVIAINRITSQPVFARVIITDDVTYPQMQFGKDFAVALKKDGTIWSWGNNSFSRDADGNAKETGLSGTGSKQGELTIPVQIDRYYENASDAVKGISQPIEKILTISVGDRHAIAVGKSGRIYAWGDNTYGQLGISPIVAPYVDRPVQIEIYKNFTKDILVKGKTDNQIVDASAGAYHTVAVTAIGEVYTWGRNDKGQLGRGYTTSDYDPENFEPAKMKGTGDNTITNVVMSAASKEATGVLLANGTVYTVGGNTRGELGVGSNAAYETELSMVNYIDSNPNAYHYSGKTEYLTDVTRIVGRGYNFAAISTKSEPEYDENGKPIYIISGGVPYQKIKYTRNRQVYAWGDDSSYQLGTGIYMPKPMRENPSTTDKFSNVPMEVTMNPDDNWANDPEYQQMEQGAYTNYASAEKPEYLRNIANISIGYSEDADGTIHTHMLATDRKSVNKGTVVEPKMVAMANAYSWGDNTSNQLGSNGAETFNSAYLIKDLYYDFKLNDQGVRVIDEETPADNNIIGIATGSNFSGAFVDDGLVYTWGSNNRGQLGNFMVTEGGTVADRPYPGYVDEEYIALGNYDIVLDKDNDTLIITAVYMRSFSLDIQVDTEKTAQLTFETLNGDIAKATVLTTDEAKEILGAKNVVQNVIYGKIELNKNSGVINYGDTKLLVKYENAANGESMTAVANVTVLGEVFDKIGEDTNGDPIYGTENIYKTTPKMQSGDGFTVVLKADGSVWSWGRNDSGQLGQGGNSTLKNIIPTQVKFDFDNDDTYIKKIAVGKSHTIALDSEGRLWSWGSNTVTDNNGNIFKTGQLGVDADEYPYSTSPILAGKIGEVDYLDGLNIVDIFTNENASYLVTSSEQVVKVGRTDVSTLTIQMPINRETYAFGSAYSSKSVSDEGDILYDDNEQERAEQTYGAAPLQLSMVKRVNKISGGNVLKFNGTVWEIPKNPMRSGFNRYTGFANTSEASSSREYLLNN